MSAPSRRHRGVEISLWMNTWHEPFTDARWRPLELFDGENVAYFGVEMTAVGRAGEAAVHMPFFSALWIEDGFVARQLLTRRREEALEAAGFTA